MAELPFVQIVREGSVTVLQLGPQAKHIEEPILERLGRELADAAQTADPPRVVVDMTAVEFFGSGFIEVLFRLSKRIGQRPDGHFALCGLQPYCREVLEITKLDRLWKLHDTRAAAVAALA
jgi:anti-anti-sigma factor